MPELLSIRAWRTATVTREDTSSNEYYIVSEAETRKLIEPSGGGVGYEVYTSLRDSDLAE